MINKILLIEDKENHLSDAKNLLEDRVHSGAISGYDFATNFEDSQRLLQSQNYLGIISDVFFPQRAGGLEEQLGTAIGEYAIQNNIPYVLVTSTHHHGEKTEPVSAWARNHGAELVDANPGKSTFEGEASEKNWKGAYFALSYLRGIKEGLVTISKEKLEDTMHYVFYYAKDLDLNSPTINRVQSLIYSGTQIANLDEVLEKYCKGMF